MARVTRKEKMKTWAEALESGEYEQCQDVLSDGKGFCCLGVYAKINNIPFTVCESHDEGHYNDKTYNTVKWQMKDHVYDEGISMNDNGKSFKEIAQMIRKEYKL